jgi:hypothetical protein
VSVRPTCMRSLGTAALGLLVACSLSACGEQAGQASDGDASSAPAQVGDCTVTAFDAASGEVGQVGTTAGTLEVKLPPDGPCAGHLVASGESGVVGLTVSGLDGSTAQVVPLDGAGEDAPQALVRVDSEPHPRGGFQPHLFTVTDEVRELTVDGSPLVPFVATDGGMAPMTATCTDDGGVAVLTATTSEPPGVVLAWDVERTTYALTAVGAEETGTAQVRDHAADPLLREEMPALFQPDALFADC